TISPALSTSAISMSNALAPSRMISSAFFRERSATFRSNGPNRTLVVLGELRRSADMSGLAKTGAVASDQKWSNSDTGGPQTRQLCARKAGLNDSYSFVDFRIGPATRWYSSIAAPNTQVRIRAPARPVAMQLRRDATAFRSHNG